MLKFEITDEYEELRDFFVENELEYDEDEPRPDDVAMWRLTDNGRLIGGCILAREGSEYIIAGIAVDPEYRGSGIGQMMMAQARKRALEEGAKRIALVARKPEFYEKIGLTAVTTEESPIAFECAACPQYGVDCFPKPMVWDFGA